MAIRGEYNPDPERRAAVHEAGHAVAGLALGISVDHATLEPPRVRYDQGPSPTRQRVADVACVTLAAGAAEEAVFGDVSVGREIDLRQATSLVAKSIG